MKREKVNTTTAHINIKNQKKIEYLVITAKHSYITCIIDVALCKTHVAQFLAFEMKIYKLK